MAKDFVDECIRCANAAPTLPDEILRYTGMSGGIGVFVLGINQYKKA